MVPAARAAGLGTLAETGFRGLDNDVRDPVIIIGFTAGRAHQLTPGHKDANRVRVHTRQLGELDAESENLRITRKTLLTVPLPSPATEPDRPDIPDHPAHQQILTALADAGRPMRARDLCQALDLPILPMNAEGIRSQLERLVSRGILIEPEPGLFARPDT
ncbi:hypothetical protein [Streptomyces sp. NPDC087437]|uniref:hypothetical protein n=1 Tax=Streptomyces sp. NPDC087437 TaxID=3365789 RepID=UPI0038052AD2